MTKRNCTEVQKQALAKRLKDMRESAGYSQQQLADMLDMTRSTYTYYELAKTMPNVFTLKKMSDIFGVPIEAFLREERKLKIVC